MTQTPDPRRWWVLGFLAVPLLAMGLDGAILTVAQPTLAADLNASITQLQWFANAYTLVVAAGMVPAGLLGDRFGQKRLLVGAVGLFALASVACAYSPSAAMLIASRAALGVGAAFLVPLSFSILTLVFPSEERGKALSIWATATAAGLPLGPALGGWLLDHYWWGTVFLVNVPPLAVAVVALWVLLPPAPGSREVSIDIVGIALSSTGLIALTYGLIESGRHGMGSGVAAMSIVVGVVLLAAFVRWVRRVPSPLIDVGLFRSRDYRWGVALGALASFGLMGALFMLPLYFQAVDGTDALVTGLRLLPVIAGMIVAVQVGERLRNTVGVRAIIGSGFVLMTVGLLIGTQTRVDTGYPLTAVWLTVVGLGLGLALPISMSLALGSLPQKQSGVGSGLVQVLRQFGSVIGVGVLGTVLTLTYRAAVDVTGVSTSVARTVQRSATAGVEEARTIGSASLEASVRQAFVHAMRVTLWVAAGAMLVGVALAYRFLPGRLGRPGTADPGDAPEAVLSTTHPVRAGG